MGRFRDLYIALEARKDDGVDLLGDNSSKPFDDAHEEAEQQRQASAAPNDAPPADNTGDDAGGTGDTGGITNTPVNTEDNPDDGGGDDLDANADDAGDDTNDLDGDGEADVDDTEGDDAADDEGDLENPDPAEDDTEIEKKNLLKQKMLKLYETVDANLDTLITNKSTNNTYDSNKYSILIQKFTMLKEKLFGLITNKKFFTQEYSTCVKFYIICNELYTTSIKLTEAYFDEYEKFIDRDKKKLKKNKRVKN